MNNIEALSELKSAKPNFDKVYFLADLLTKDSEPEEIKDVLYLAGKLSAIECRKVSERIKRKTGLPLAEIKNAYNEEFIFTAEEPDHHTFAQSVIAQVGRENLLTTVAHTWRWDDSGKWRTIPDRELKKLVQNALVDGGAKITKYLVDAVTEVLKTDLYTEEHEWARNADVINFQNGEVRRRGGKWVIEEHCREHYLTIQIPHIYNPNADCPRFQEFLQEIFQGDSDGKEKAQLILEMLGYSRRLSAYGWRAAARTVLGQCPRCSGNGCTGYG